MTIICRSFGVCKTIVDKYDKGMDLNRISAGMFGRN